MGMGYAGYCILSDGSGKSVILLCTGSGVNLVLEPISSTAVWGAGWYNAGRPTHYADSAIRYEGNIDIELQGIADLWTMLREWAVEKRAYPKSIEMSPDGARIFYYTATGTDIYDRFGAFCRSLNFATSEGSFVTSSIDMLSIYRTEQSATPFSGGSYIDNKYGVIGHAYGTFKETEPLNCDGYNASPIPFWQTVASIQRLNGGSWGSVQTGIETVDWSIDIANNTIALFTMDGERLPSAVLQGPMDVTGNVTLYDEDGVIDPVTGDGSGTITSPYLYACNTRFVVWMGLGNGSYFTIFLPAVFVNSDDYSIPGQDSIVNRTWGLTAMGGHDYTWSDGAASNSTYVQPPVVFDTVDTPPY